MQVVEPLSRGLVGTTGLATSLSGGDVGQIAAVIVALAALFASWRIGQSANRQSSWNVYFELVRRYESPAVALARTIVLKERQRGLLSEESSVWTIFGCFEAYGYVVRKGVVKGETVWTWNGDRAVAYWWAFKDLIESARQQSPEYFAEYGWLVERLNDISLKHKDSTYVPEPEDKWVNYVLAIDLADAERSLSEGHGSTAP